MSVEIGDEKPDPVVVESVPPQESTPPTPRPESPVSTDGPSRSEFDGLSSAVQSLTESVSRLVEGMTPRKADSTPLDKGPWTAWGSKQRHITDEGS